MVTATFNHVNPLVIDVTLSSGAEFSCTAPHRFYSETRAAWVAADDLRQGERLRLADGEASVTSLTRRWGEHQVFNLEVDLDHTYYVTSQRVLTHNTYGEAFKKARDELKAKHGDAVGSYTITFASGRKYHGKGNINRANISASYRARRAPGGNDVVTGIEFAPARGRTAKARNHNAFLDEQKRIKTHLDEIGVRHPSLTDEMYNQIHSPGATKRIFSR